MGPFTIKGTSWSKHWIFFKDFIWYVVCLPWLKILNLIVFHTTFWLNINIETTYDPQYNKTYENFESSATFQSNL
jgi:hypothetical protein